MSAASPTPMGNAQGPGLTRRTSQRQALRRPPSRSQLARAESNPAGSAKKSDYPGNPNDSSDDEIPVPMKLSALTKALLNDGGPDAQRPSSPPRTRRRASNLAAATEERRHLRSGSVQAHETRSSRPASPHRSKGSRENSPVRKRVVRLSNTARDTGLGQVQPEKRRSISTRQASRDTLRTSRTSSQHETREQPSADEKPAEPQPNVYTPQSQGMRVVRISASSASRRSVNGSSVSRRSNSHLESEVPSEPAVRDSAPPSHGSESQAHSNGSRNAKVEDNLALQSSMRVKRVGKVPGSFLSGPARRGRRRQSEEEAEANGEGDGLVSSQEPDSIAPEMDHEPASSFYGNGREFASGSPVPAKDSSRAAHRRQLSNALMEAAQPAAEDDYVPEVHIPFKLPASRPEIPSARDQENAPPSSFRRSKSGIDLLPHSEIKEIPKRPVSTDVHNVRPASPERQPLAALARNTPHRPAPPPPPKMSVLQAATSTANATTTSQGAKQRRNVLRVNGKTYTRLDCLGRGGSAKVYRVTAENGTMFALKRVSLEQADPMTIKGYRGEIDLLGKLTTVDRVINLYDWEMNDEKKMLTLVSTVQARSRGHL